MSTADYFEDAFSDSSRQNPEHGVSTAEIVVDGISTSFSLEPEQSLGTGLGQLAKYVMARLSVKVFEPEGWTHLTVHLGGTEYPVELGFEDGEEAGRVVFRFADGSTTVAPDLPDSDFDSGLALLKPISARELAGVEPILAQLWAVLDRAELSQTQQHQIVAMAEMIKAEQLAAMPGVTARWKLVGAVRAVLKYGVKELPRDALSLIKLSELLREINWSTLASELTL